jgi:hypothetical protein
MTVIPLTTCAKALWHGIGVKAACATITTLLFTITGYNFVLYEAVFIAWMIALGLGFIIDLRDKTHPFNNFAGGLIWIFAYISLILVTHQLVRIYPYLHHIETLTAAYCATNEILKTHGYAKQLGFTLLDPLTKHINKYLNNLTNNGKSD